MKDMGHPLLQINPEQREILQNMVDTLYVQFLEAVVTGREAYTDADQLRPVADGRVYTATQALELGLVDGIQYLDEVITELKEAVGAPDAMVVAYRYGNGLDATIYDASGPPRLPGQGPLVNVDMGTLFGHGEPGFYYLWQPAE
jgi:protease-4